MSLIREKRVTVSIYKVFNQKIFRQITTMGNKS